MVTEPFNVPEDDDRADLELAIADQIAELSQTDATPTEFDPLGRVIDPSEVDFETAGWMVALGEIQGWLRLPDALPSDDPRGFVSTLGRCLEIPDEAQTDDPAADQPVVTTELLEVVSDRLQRARRLQELYLADLEAEGSTPASATAIWVERWEVEDAASESGNGSVSARALTWNINEFSDRASRGRLDLSPPYQRSDVWPDSDAALLIESILRGIPLPSVIILKPPADTAYEVVDGKQRLTAILRFIGMHPGSRQHVKRAMESFPDEDWDHLFTRDYPRFRRLWKNKMGEPPTSTREREYYFPFKLRGSNSTLTGQLATFQGKYYTQIRDSRVKIAEDEVEVRELFEHVTEYRIPLIEYSKATPRQIHEVFTLYNKQGKHLNAEEIRNAVYHNVDLARALIVVSGDIDDVEKVAPFLRPEWLALGHISEILTDYRFGTARYRRTKVLSWLVSVLLTDSSEGGQPRRLSTARHIDALFNRITTSPADRLRDHETIRELLVHVLQGLEAHSGVPAWAPVFKDSKSGAKWQELQLVASALGVVMAATVLEDGTIDRLDDVASQLRDKTSSRDWKRPLKTQTATQWDYLATISLGVVETLNVDLALVSDRLIERYGISCVPALKLIRTGASSD